MLSEAQAGLHCFGVARWVGFCGHASFAHPTLAIGEYLGNEFAKNQKERDKLFSELHGDYFKSEEPSASKEVEISQAGVGAPLPPDPDDSKQSKK